MRAVVFRGIGNIRLEKVPDPKIQKATDAIVRLTASAICGTDLHMVRGTMAGMVPGTILGHEGVGVVEELGGSVRNLKPGDRVVVPSTIGCGNCSYCRAGYYSQCNNANPNGPAAGTAFYGGPKLTGPFDGMQAEYVRVPYAHINLVKLPDDVTDDSAILVSDIFPTGYMAAELAEIHPGSTVAVYGCGPVGQFAIASAKLLNAGRIIAIDSIPSRLEMARRQGAEIINYEKEDPLAAIRELTGGIGVDRVIDCVGIDANRPHRGPAARKGLFGVFGSGPAKKPKGKPAKGNWEPGDAPAQVLEWAVESIAKAGTLSIIGVYGELEAFPIGNAMEKNLTIKMGNCNHRKYIPRLLDIIRAGVVDPSKVLTQVEPMTDVIEAYKLFDRRTPGWIKVMLQPQSVRKAAQRIKNIRRRRGRLRSTLHRQYNVLVLSVRNYQPGDFKRLLEIDQSCFVEGIAYSEEELRYFLAMPTAISLVGLDDERILAFIIADRFRPRKASRSVGKIITIDVAPEAQHGGVGSLLMKSAEAELKANGCDYVSLEVAVDNQAALSFYKKHGYSVLKVLPRYYLDSIDGLLMGKKLEAFALQMET